MATDEYGVLEAPRFVPQLPGRIGGQGRITAARKHITALRDRPLVWAAILESDKPHPCSNISTAIRRGSFGPTTHWESAMRKHPDNGRFVLYVRYVGPVKPAVK